MHRFASRWQKRRGCVVIEIEAPVRHDTLNLLIVLS
jgi:hypothetical protein